MAYVPFHADWKDAPDASTPITAAALEYIEGGIAAAYALGEAAVAKALINAKGDLLVGTADDTLTRLAVGADDTVPAADSSQSTGITWKKIGNAMVASGAGITYSKLALTDSIVNADIASAAAIAQSKLAFASYTSWSPTKITQDASSVTNVAHTVNYGKYFQIGKLTHLSLKVTFSAAGTAGQTIIVQGAPAPSVSGNAIGAAIYNDFGTAIIALLASVNTSGIQFVVPGSSSAFGTSTTIANNDTLQLTVVYEAA